MTEEHDDVMMVGWKMVIDAYATHIGKENMQIIMVRDQQSIETDISQVLSDMKDANGKPCTKYPEGEVYDLNSDEGMHLLFPHHNMHYVFPHVHEESVTKPGATRIRAYGNRLAIAGIINANMKDAEPV